MKKLLLISFFALGSMLLLITVHAQNCGGVCSGFRTQTQGGWGAKPNGGNPGVYLHANFAAAFPNGLTIGCGTKTVKYTTAQKISDNLPAGGGPTVLPNGNVEDPAVGCLNTELDGQIISAMLNVGFDHYDANFGTNNGSCGEIIFNSGTFSGKSVQFVIDEANKAIGSCGSSYSLVDLNSALTQFNENFDNGTTNQNHFNSPGSLPVVAGITGTLTVCAGATTALTSATAGGVWSSSDASIVTVNAATGVVTGVAVGTATIRYSVTNGCGVTTVSATVICSAAPVVSAITGTLTVCAGATTTLSDATAGGVWSSSNASIATVNAATGVVTGVAAGTATIRNSVTNGCGVTTVSATVAVTDCSGVPGGGGGGLESKSLGDAVGNRIFNRAVNNQTLIADYSKLPQISAVAGRNTVNGIGTSLSLSEILPKQISGTAYKAYNSTPTDIAAITNATDVLSIDFTLNNQAKAVAFGTKTSGEVYDHTKAVCDRLKGSELMHIQHTTVNGVSLVRYDLMNTKGQMEYAFSFVIGAKNGRSNYTIQSNWLNKDYSADEVMFNIQLWAETPSLIENMAADIIDRLNGSMPVSAVQGNQSIPKTYIAKGVRASENMVMSLNNTDAAANGYFELLIKDNEQSTGFVTKKVPFNVAANGKASVTIPAGDSYESTINMYVNGIMVDQVFLADGNWAVNANTANSAVKSFKISNDTKRSAASADDFLLFRNVQVEANTPDYISVYKLLRGGGASQDLSGFKTFQFTAKGAGATLNITLVKESTINWTDQFSINLPLTANAQDYKVSLSDFVSGSGTAKLNPNDISHVVFGLVNGSGKVSTINAEISNVSFSKKDVSLMNSLNSGEVNIYPNPSIGSFVASFKAAQPATLTLKLTDASTGLNLLNKVVNAQEGVNNVPVSVDRKSALGTYILTIEGAGVQYNPKKVIVADKQ